MRELVNAGSGLAGAGVAGDEPAATELVSLSPDVILGAADSTIPTLLGATRTVPIVFAQVLDPVGAGSACGYPIDFNGDGRSDCLRPGSDGNTASNRLLVADGSGLFPEARPKLAALSWEEIRLALMLDISSN